MIKSLLSKALEQKFREDHFEDCFLVDITVTPQYKLTVYIDADSGLTLERCKNISRYLERQIEQNQWAPEKYTLEVSSPGVDRPLKLKRQYTKNKGRTIRVHLKNGSIEMGKLIGLTDDEIVLETEKNKELELKFDDIEKAIVQISFK